GHAGMDVEGQDIVCAAVSVLIINTVNAIEKYATDETSLVSDDLKGLIDYKLLEKPTKEATLLLKAMVLGLEEIANDENYEEYIDLTFKEV
ncbi:MAG: ribosomal-processing cysteine protease Prp, partial [Lachnospiraceae bacterium]